MKALTVVVVIVLVFTAAALGVIYSGLYHVGASVPHSGFTEWVLHTTMERSVARRATEIDVPDLGAEELRLAGINDFEAMCAVCHTAPGTQASPLARGLNPPAPDLALSAEELSPQELFWITKHGIRMTGMPAWGATHADEEIWPVVAFMETLPGLRVAEYREMLEAAKGHGHHAGEVGEAGGHDDEAGHHETGSTAGAEDADDHEHAGDVEPQ